MRNPIASAFRNTSHYISSVTAYESEGEGSTAELKQILLTLMAAFTSLFTIKLAGTISKGGSALDVS